MARTVYHPTRNHADWQWREDLGFMATRMKDIHPNLFHAVPQERFEVEVRKLETGIPHRALPAYWRNLACNYWFEHLAAYRAIYVGFNLAINTTIKEGNNLF